MQVEDPLGLLEDGEWHLFDELSKKLDLLEDKMVEFIRFWATYGFVELDESQRRVRMLKDTQRLISAERTVTLHVTGHIKSWSMNGKQLVIKGDELSAEWADEEEDQSYFL